MGLYRRNSVSAGIFCHGFFRVAAGFAISESAPGEIGAKSYTSCQAVQIVAVSESVQDERV